MEQMVSEILQIKIEIEDEIKEIWKDLSEDSNFEIETRLLAGNTLDLDYTFTFGNDDWEDFRNGTFEEVDQAVDIREVFEEIFKEALTVLKEVEND